MGRPKLMLPCGPTTLIARVLAAWQASRVDRIVLVIRQTDEALIEHCRRLVASSATPFEAPRPVVDIVLPPVDPPDMKDSVAHAIRFLDDACTPRDEDAWLLAPADIPDLSPHVIDALVGAHDPAQPAILTPVSHGRRGHPILLPWPLAREVLELGAHEGVNALLRRHPTREVPVDSAGDSGDIDTPDDYDQWRQRNVP